MDVLDTTFQDEINKALAKATNEKELQAIVDSAPQTLEELLNNTPSHLLSDIKTNLNEGLSERRKLNHGFVERNLKRWRSGFDLLELQIEISIEAGQSFNERLRPQAVADQNALFDVLVRLHARGCLVSNEILSLLKSGYADGAHARWRALHELSVTAMFLAKHGNNAAIRYIEYEIVEAYKGAHQLSLYEHRLNTNGFSHDELSELQSNYDLVIQKNGNEFTRNYGWAAPFLTHKDLTFAALEKNVELDHWRPSYRWASQNIHANFKSLSPSLGLSEAKGDLLQVGPSNSGMTEPAHSTALSISQLTSTLLLSDPNIDGIILTKAIAELSDEIGQAFLDSDTQ